MDSGWIKVLAGIGVGVLLIGSKCARHSPDAVSGARSALQNTPLTSVDSARMGNTFSNAATSLDDFVAARSAITESDEVRVIGILPPDSVSYESMFGETPYSASAQRDMLRFGNSLNRMSSEARVIMDSTTPAAKVFENIFSTMRNDVAVLSGHSIKSDTGRALVMPSGRAISVQEVREIARRYGKQFVLVTCYSEDLPTSSSITFRQASRYVASIESLPKTASWEEVAAHIATQARLDNKRRATTLIAAGGAGVGTTAYFVYFEMSPDEESEPRPVWSDRLP